MKITLNNLRELTGLNLKTDNKGIYLIVEDIFEDGSNDTAEIFLCDSLRNIYNASKAHAKLNIEGISGREATKIIKAIDYLSLKEELNNSNKSVKKVNKI